MARGGVVVRNLESAVRLVNWCDLMTSEPRCCVGEENICSKRALAVARR